MVSAIAASGIGVFVLWAVDLAKRLGVANHVPGLVLWPVTASLIYAGLYWLFDKRVWKIGVIANLLKVPDLAGKWHCDGQTINPDKTLGYKWEGEVTIIQSWDKLRVRLKTTQSASNSIAAALVYDQADGFRLLYNYKNEPKIGEAELVAHRGAAELTFSTDLTAAEGEYFNGHGRFTFGNIKLTRKD
ncbi:Cap15 family cyclic dinucleotide receptor domain-containing protein [Burkholderia sp. AW33-5]